MAAQSVSSQSPSPLVDVARALGIALAIHVDLHDMLNTPDTPAGLPTADRERFIDVFLGRLAHLDPACPDSLFRNEVIWAYVNFAGWKVTDTYRGPIWAQSARHPREW